MDHVHQSSSKNQSKSVAEGQKGGAGLSAPAYGLSNKKKGSSGGKEDVVGDKQQQYSTVKYNLIAHGFAYTDALRPDQIALAQAMGFESGEEGGWSAVRDDNAKSGLFAGLLMPDIFNADADVNPVLAFRGSETGDQFKLDWYNNDMDPIAVGYTAFQLNYKDIESLLAQAVERSGKRVVVTGHSLGGSLAKQAALHFPQFVSACYTFQAPGISAEQQKILEQRGKGNKQNINGENWHESVKDDKNYEHKKAILPDSKSHSISDIYFEAHSSKGDIVNYANGGRVPDAKRIKHKPSGLENTIPLSHMLMLTSSEHYKDGHEVLKGKLGDRGKNLSTKGLYEMSKKLDAKTGNPEKVSPMDTTGAPERRNDTTHEGIEAIRKFLVAETMNPHAELINKLGEKRINQIPLQSKIIILESLLNGPGLIESMGKGALGGALISTLLNKPFAFVGGLLGGLSAFGKFGGESGAGSLASFAGGAVGGSKLGSLIPIGIPKPLSTILGGIGGIALAGLILRNDVKTTQEAAYTLVKESEGDQVGLIQGVGGASKLYSKMNSIGNKLFGSKVFEELRAEMRLNYFRNLNVAQGADEVTNNLKGGFLGFGDKFQEMLIVDVLIFGAVSADVLAQVGGGDYNKGLEIVLRKLQGEEDKEITNAFKFTNGKGRKWYSMW